MCISKFNCWDDEFEWGSTDFIFNIGTDFVIHHNNYNRLVNNRHFSGIVH